MTSLQERMPYCHMCPKDLIDSISKASDDYFVAADLTKRYGLLDLCKQVAVVNQLRYVGQHALRAADAVGEGKSPVDELRKMESHAKRAVNDTKDSAIISALEHIRNLVSWKFTSSELEQVFGKNNFLSSYDEIFKIRNILENAGMAKDIQLNGEVDQALVRWNAIYSGISERLKRLESDRVSRMELRDRLVLRHGAAVAREKNDRERDMARKRKLQTILLLCLSVTAVVLVAAQITKGL